MAASHKGRLLIVDDEVELNSALCDTLADEGYETQGATSGAAGLSALEKQDFDVLLSDLMMPGMDGIQTLRKALEHDPNLVGIIMTGQGTIPTAVEAMKAGAFDYLLKPFNLQTMLPILARRWKYAGCGWKTCACAAVWIGSLTNRRATRSSAPARLCSACSNWSKRSPRPMPRCWSAARAAPARS